MMTTHPVNPLEPLTFGDSRDKQEVWPLGSANTVCPRRPLMTQVQHREKTAQTDHVTLRPWPLTLESWRPWLIRVVVLHLYTKFEVCRPCHSEDMGQRTMCVSINEPGDLDLWQFDLLTLKLVCKSHQRWGTILPNMGKLGLWVLELVTMSTTDGRADKSNAYCPLPYGRWHKNTRWSVQDLHNISLMVLNQLHCHQTNEYEIIDAKDWLAVWLSGNALASINIVALPQTRLVPGWVTPSVSR